MQPHVVLRPQVGDEEDHVDAEEERPGDAEIAQHAPDTRQPPEGPQVEDERPEGQGHEQAPVTAGERLEREEGGGREEVGATGASRVAVEEGEAERDPLDGGEVHLGEAHEARRAEGEDHPRRQGGGHARAELAGEDVGPEAAQDAGEQHDHVQRQHGVAGGEERRRAQHGAAEDVLRVGEGAGLGKEDVRVEERQGVVEKRLDVPGDRPEEEARVGGERQRLRRGREAEGRGQDEGEEHEEEADEGRLARPFGQHPHENAAIVLQRHAPPATSPPGRRRPILRILGRAAEAARTAASSREVPENELPNVGSAVARPAVARRPRPGR